MATKKKEQAVVEEEEVAEIVKETINETVTEVVAVRPAGAATEEVLDPEAGRVTGYVEHTFTWETAK